MFQIFSRRKKNKINNKQNNFDLKKRKKICCFKGVGKNVEMRTWRPTIIKSSGVVHEALSDIKRLDVCRKSEIFRASEKAEIKRKSRADGILKVVKSFFFRRKNKTLVSSKIVRWPEFRANKKVRAKRILKKFFHFWKRPKNKWMSFSTALASVVIAILILESFLISGVQGATFRFQQANWSGGSTANVANHNDDQSGWSEYSSKDEYAEIVNDGEDIQLKNKQGSYTETTDADFGQGTLNNTVIVGNGEGAQVETGGRDLYLLGDRYMGKGDTKGSSWDKTYEFHENSNNATRPFFLDDDLGWVGGSSAVYKTTDGGETWAKYEVSSSFVYAIHFIDSLTGWSVGSNGSILKTVDGGETWVSQASPVSNFDLNYVYFQDANEGLAASRYLLLKTIDGGTTWNIVGKMGSQDSFYRAQFISGSTGYNININYTYKTTDSGVTWNRLNYGSGGYGGYFISESIGWVVGFNGKIIKTTNGGTSWTTQTSGTSASLYSAYFVDANVGWVGGDSGVILKTTNGGSSWTIQSSGILERISHMKFSDANNGVANGNSYNLKTTDGGTTWNIVSNSAHFDVRDGYFVDSLTGWMVGYSGKIAKTTDGGAIWNLQTSGTTQSLYSVYFVDSNIGWAVGIGGIILKTTNGGTNWTAQTSGTTRSLNSVYFFDSNNGWIAGTNGTILKTTDGGTNWSVQTFGSQFLYSIYFTDLNNGFIGGSGGTILKTTNGGANWAVQSTGISEQINDIHFNDSNTGWAVGNSGVILKTTNGGVNWTGQASLTIQNLNDVHFTDSNNGWVVGESGTIRKTTNGGTNWTTQASGTTQTLRGVNFVGLNNGWIIGSDGVFSKTTDGGSGWDILFSYSSNTYFTDSNTGWAVGNSGVILKTVNGGTSWTMQTSGTAQNLNAVHFIDSNIGWAVGNAGVILKTTDSGVTWNAQSSTLSQDLNYVYFASDSVGFVYAGSKMILWTDDGGTTWNRNNNYNDFYFIDSSTGWVVGDSGAILKTTNGGTNWNVQTSTTTQALNAIHFVDSNIGWAVGANGTILKTANGGSSWVLQMNGVIQTLNDVYFTDADTGLIVGNSGTIVKLVNGIYGSEISNVGSNGSDYYIRVLNESEVILTSPNGGIMKSNDGGVVWTSKQGVVNKTFFTDSNNGWQAGYAGRIFKTIDGGTNWTAQASGTTQNLNDIYFVDSNTGWAVGISGVISKTTDGGASWTMQTSGTTRYLYGVYFFDSNNGWVVGGNGTILKTTDGGSSWNVQTSGTAQLNSVYFIDSSNGWAVGTSGVILKTTDGGSSWNAQTSGTTQQLNHIYFIDSNTGWAVGNSGTILKTTNGGSSWNAQICGTSQNLSYVYFISSNVGWTVGESGTVLKTTSGGVFWGAQTSGTSSRIHAVFVDNSAQQSPVYTSKVIDLNGSKKFQTVDYSVSVPTGASFSLDIRFGNNYVPDGTWTDWQMDIQDNGDISQFSNYGFFQYRVNMTDNSFAQSPALQDMLVNYNYYQNSSLISSSYDAVDVTNVLMKMDWIESLPANTDVTFQVRTSPDNLTWTDWVGPDGTALSSFTDSLGNEDMPALVTDGVDDRYIQYKTTLSTDGINTPVVSSANMTYVVNASPQLQNMDATQGSDGVVTVNYEVLDSDTSTGVNQGTVSITLQYCSGNCSISGSEIWTDAVSVTGGVGASVAVEEQDYTPYQITWVAKNDVNGTYDSTFKLRLVANDGELANSTAYSVDTLNLDVKDPQGISFSIDHTQNILYLTEPEDDSSLQMAVSNYNDFRDNPEYEAIQTNYPYNDLTSDPATVYLRVMDAYGNSVQVQQKTPARPANILYYDVSNTGMGQFREFIAWDVISSFQSGSGFASYELYRSADGIDYSHLASIIDRNLNYYMDDDLVEGTHYYYKLFAEDTNGDKSAYSQIVQDTPDGQGGSDLTPPTSEGLNVSQITTTSAKITWNTDELSDSIVGYSEDETYLFERGVTSMVFVHEVVLTDLDPGTTYNIRIKSRDVVGNLGQNDKDDPGSSLIQNFTFATLPGPAISSVTVPYVSNNEATIAWKTSTDASSHVIYSDTISDGSLVNSEEIGTPDLVGGNFPYDHFVTIDRFAGVPLVHNTRYYFFVKSVDASGNIAIDNNGGHFYELLTTSDSVPPEISNLDEPMISNVGAVISWTTNENANSLVEYGETSGLYDMSQEISSYDHSHFVILSTLDADTDYYYRVSSSDINGNQVVSDEGHFKTTKDPLLDHDPLSKITFADNNPSVLTDTTAVISFSTDQEADCFAEYGTNSEEYQVPINETGYNKGHAIHLMGLIFNTKYFYKITCEDNLGTVVTSEEKDFTTKEKLMTGGEWGEGSGDDSIAPIISNVKSSEITGESVTITWDTDENSNSLVKYGSESSYGNVAGDSAILNDKSQFTKTHTVSIVNIIPSTKYVFRVVSADASGNSGESDEYSFTTSVSSSISSIEAKSTEIGQAIVTWSTSKSASSIVEYGTSTSYSEKMESDTFVKDHEVHLSGLNQGITYHFRVKGEDEDGRIYASSDQTFEPKSPPKISDVYIGEVSEHSAEISFKTNVPTDANVTYSDTRENKDSGSQGKPDLSTDHKIKLDNLLPGTTYSIKIIVRDEQGTQSEQQGSDFTTGKDENPPLIDQIKTESALTQYDKVQAIINWKTNEKSKTSLVYREGKNGEDKEIKIPGDLTDTHIAVLTVLKPGLVYYFKVKAVDSSGNEAVSSDYALLTPRRKENIIQIIINNFQEIFNWTNR